MVSKNRVFTLPPKTRLNSNIAICGASGTGKSRSVTRNLILQAAKRGDSLIVTDPKSEIYESMSQYLREQGYTVQGIQPDPDGPQATRGTAWKKSEAVN